jgi:peptidoglycan/xylan/chitin deacetylase (PgdA/CDA1 family)
MRIRNFLFHRVSPIRDLLWDPMSPELFENCIKYISANYKIITIEDLMNPHILDPKFEYSTISFDDGYKDNIQFAIPILEKYKIKASFYIVTDCIEKNIPTWTHILEYSFQNTNKTDINLNYSFLPANLRVDKLTSVNERLKYIVKLKPYLKKLNHEHRLVILNHISKYFNDVTLPDLMMNWEDVRILQNLGHHVGSHTVSHCMLGTMSDSKLQEMELKKSYDVIFDKTGVYPVTISYPVGSYNSDTIEISRKIGYKLGLAVKQEIYYPERCNLFEIPRIELYNESWFKTKLRISHRLEEIKKIIRYR